MPAPSGHVAKQGSSDSVGKSPFPFSFWPLCLFFWGGGKAKPPLAAWLSIAISFQAVIADIAGLGLLPSLFADIAVIVINFLSDSMPQWPPPEKMSLKSVSPVPPLAGGAVAFIPFLLASSPAATFRRSVSYQSVFSFGETSLLSQTVKRFADLSPKHISLAAIGGRLLCFKIQPPPPAGVST